MTAPAPHTVPRTNGTPAVPPKLPETAPNPLPDLGALSDEMLAALVDRGQAEIVRRKKAREATFLAMVAETAKTLGIAPARVAAAIANRSRPRAAGHAAGSGDSRSDGRSDVKPVYRDPVSGATWSGRGQPPPFIEFGDETNPKTGKPLPLRKFWIAEQEK